MSTYRNSNSLFIEVLDPLPLENIGWTAMVLSEADYVSPVAEVTRFAELQFQKEKSGVGGGSVTLDMADPLWSAALPSGQTTPIRDQQAIWQVLDDGVPRFAFFAEDVQEDVVKDGLRTCVISGRGIGVCLEWAIVLPAGFPATTDPDRTFTGAAMGGFLTLLTESKARGEIDWVQATFDASFDSRGVPWSTGQTLIATAGTNLLDLLNSWCEQTGASWKMLPGFKLWVEQTDGNDRSATVVFSIGGQQVDHGKKKTRREIANAVYASGAGGISQVSDGTSIAKWRKRARWVEAGQAGDSTARDLVAAATVRLLGEQKIEREVKVHPDATGRRIFVDYDVIDWVTIEPEEGDGDSSVVQVKAATIKVDSAGTVDLELSVGSRFDAFSVQVNRLLNKLGAQQVSGTSSAVPISTTTIISNTRLRELADVNLLTAGAGDVLAFDGTNWVDKAIALDDMSDVSSPSPTDGHVLMWEQSSGLWKPKAASTAGGGPGVDTRWAPYGSPTYAEEFEGSSLGADWGRVDESGGAGRVTWAVAGGVLSSTHNNTADSSARMHWMLKPVGSAFAAGDAIVTAYRVAHAGWAPNYVMCNVGLTNGTTPGASSAIATQAYVNSSNGSYGIVRNWANTSMTSDGAESGEQAVSHGGLFWLRLVMTAANTWRSDWSGDGISWMLGSPRSYSLTPTHMGVGHGNWTTTVRYNVTFECFRRYSGVP